MKDIPSRRDMLKLGAAGLAAVSLPELGSSEALAQGGVDFDINAAPNSKFIGFTADAMPALNIFSAVSIKSLADKYPQILASAQGIAAVKVFEDGVKTGDAVKKGEGWTMILAASGNSMYGAPNPYGIPVTFKNNMPLVSDLAPGDILINSSGVKRISILARSNQTDTGVQVALASFVDAKGIITASWMTDKEIQSQLGSDVISAKRTAEMNSLMNLKTAWLKQYANDLEAIRKGYLPEVNPERIAKLLAGINTQAQNQKLNSSERAKWIFNQVGRTVLGENLDSNWPANLPGYKRLAHGMGEALMFYGTFPAAGGATDSYWDQILRPDGLRNYIQGVPDANIVVKTPGIISDLNTGDAIIISPVGKLEKPLVGIVSLQPGEVPGTAHVTYFDLNGSGMAKMDAVTDIQGIARLGGREGAKVTIVRSLDTELKRWNDMQMANHIRDVSKVPEQIAFAKPGFHHDFTAIPEAHALQDALAASTNLKDRGEILMQMAGMLGVQTKGASAYAPIWNPDAGYDVCNLYSTDFVRLALGYGGQPGDISHWVTDKESGKLTFNTGVELGAWAMNWWMRHFGEAHGWKNVTQTTKQERLDLLKRGYILYGAKSYANNTSGDTLVIFGIEGPNGETVPVLTKGSYNHLIVYPYRKYHFEDPMDYFNVYPDAVRFLPDTRAILWAHALPGAK